MRSWLLSNTTYGTWLPGSSRGSVTSVRDRRPDDPLDVTRVEHDLPGEPWEDSIPGLWRSAFRLMKGQAIYFELWDPAFETWWTTNGSKRKLKDDIALENALNYVLYKQPNPLVVWSPDLGRII